MRKSQRNRHAVHDRPIATPPNPPVVVATVAEHNAPHAEVATAPAAPTVLATPRVTARGLGMVARVAAEMGIVRRRQP